MPMSKPASPRARRSSSRPSCCGEADGVGPAAGSESHARHFTGPYRREVVPGAGHFLPRETPEAVVGAVRELGGL